MNAGSGHAGHDHGHSASRNALQFALVLTVLTFVLELAGGYLFGSLALLSDAWHVATDAFALALGWFARVQAERPRDFRKTFGYRRIEVFSGLVNGTALIVVSIFIFIEAVERFFEPPALRVAEAAAVALIGLLVNLAVAGLLRPHRNESMNIRGAFLHVLGDALASMGVIAGLVIIGLTGWRWIDPAAASLICLYLVRESFVLVRGATHILFEGAPLEFDIAVVIERLKTLDEVADVHDVHVWSISGSDVYVSLHVVTRGPVARTRDVLDKVECILHDDFGADHVNIQIEEECSRRHDRMCPEHMMH